ncbi:MAG: hypothetical protein V9G22_12010 [Ottowia sp.]
MKPKNNIDLFDKTDTEEVIDHLNEKFGDNLTARGAVTASVIQVFVGTLLVNLVDDKGPFFLLVPLGLMMILLGTFGVLMWKGDMVRQGLREKALAKRKQQAQDKR